MLGGFESGERNCRKSHALFTGEIFKKCVYTCSGPALVKTLRRAWLHVIQSVSRTLQDYDYGTKVRLRSLIGEYRDFRILRSLNKNPKL